MLAVPLQRVWALPWLGSRLQPPEIAGLSVIVLAAWRIATAGVRPARHPLDAGVLCWWAAVTIAAAVGAARGGTPATALATEWLASTYLVLLFFALRVVLAPAHLATLLTAFVLSAAVAGSLGLAGMVIGADPRRLLSWAVEVYYPYAGSATRARGLTMGPTMLANLLIAALFALPFVRWTSAVRRGAGLLLVAALAATVSKSAVVLVAGGFVAAACLAARRPLARRLLVAGAALVAGVYIAATHFVLASPAAARALTTDMPVIGTTPVAQVPVPGRELFVYPTNYVVNRRSSIAAIRAAWPAGLGPGGYHAFVEREVASGLRDPATRRWSDPHSTYLGIVVELGLAGVLGFLALAAAIVAALRRAWHATPDAPDGASGRLAVAVLTGAVAAFAIEATVTDVMNFRHLWLGLAALAVWTGPVGAGRVAPHGSTGAAERVSGTAS